MGRRIDQPAVAVAADQPVSRPQVAVQPRRWLATARELLQHAGDALQPGDGGGVERMRVGGEAGERQETLRRVELGPGRARLVRQRTAARRAPVGAPERRAPRRCNAARPGRARSRCRRGERPRRSIRARGSSACRPTQRAPQEPARPQARRASAGRRPPSRRTPAVPSDGSWRTPRGRPPARRADDAATSPPCTRAALTIAASSAPPSDSRNRVSMAAPTLRDRPAGAVRVKVVRDAS